MFTSHGVHRYPIGKVVGNNEPGKDHALGKLATRDLVKNDAGSIGEKFFKKVKEVAAEDVEQKDDKINLDLTTKIDDHTLLIVGDTSMHHSARTKFLKEQKLAPDTPMIAVYQPMPATEAPYHMVDLPQMMEALAAKTRELIAAGGADGSNAIPAAPKPASGKGAIRSKRDNQPGGQRKTRSGSQAIKRRRCTRGSRARHTGQSGCRSAGSRRQLPSPIGRGA